MNEVFKKGLKAFFFAVIIMFALLMIMEVLNPASGSSFNKDIFIADLLWSLMLGVIVIIIYIIDLAVIRKKKRKSKEKK
jgi:polyferredoxin